MDWFNTNYYHTLYKHRDLIEAKKFIDTLVKYLNIKKGLNVLDLACGAGRHSKHLEKLGFKVTGIDRSANNIKKAKKYKSSNLKFFKKEMTDDFEERFDIVLNLFTSFGYENENYNQKTIENISKNLKKDGILIIDYLNYYLAEKNLVTEETKYIEGLKFNIERYSDDKYIYKKISIDDKNSNVYYEKVMKIDVDNFNSYCSKNNLEISKIYGNYNLDEFDIDTSERLIMIIKKSQP